ncbi:hypothetical protein CL1_1307 [Thermococcus cleftensis]|uniref:S-layer protein C-terminal domain-containing protein n=1 Tax=Thermococcus cleftensis (strain DSM 27260 / KACC 17922 / CL1) TaxID=163003 RepID=I3ZUX2_THECF|nr:hypothetical protein [Thermococcus cleftensis]AFL95506.1 hypothetical protein CL1_1307 [Thermococcus cleftensis]
MRRIHALFVSLLLLASVLPAAAPAVVVTAPRPPLIIVGNPPAGHSVAPYTDYTVYFLVADDYGVTTGSGRIAAYYRINGGEWKEAYLKTTAENPVVASLRARFYGESQNFYVFYRRFTIPGLPPGSRVEFRVEATDVEGHTSYSPVYTYYVVNPQSPRVLVVDPSVDAVGFLPYLDSIEGQLNVSRDYYHYNLSDVEAVAGPLGRVKGDLFTVHRWELLAGEYNISVVSPSELRKALEDFEPQVVILSNLWLPEWGLSGEDMKALHDYLHLNGAGLIVTSGTLLDSTNPQHIGTPGNISVASMLRMEPLQLALAVRKALNVSDVPLMVMNVNTGYPLTLSRKGPFDGGRLEVNVSTTVGWQYYLPAQARGIADRSVELFIRENGRAVREMEEAVANLTGARFNFSMTFAMAGALANMEVVDGGVLVTYGGLSATLPLEGKLLERVRLLHALRKRYPVILARTDDYSAAILASDGDYRAVYSSLELEAGGETEFGILRDLVDWAMKPSPQMPEVVVLSNDIDWNIKGRLLASQLQALGFTVTRVTAEDIESRRDAKVVLILGGPDAYDGVGDYVRQVLSAGEQEAVRTGRRGVFAKTDVWSGGQVVIVLAGRDRWGTGEKIKAYMEGVDFGYAELLAGFAALI